MRVWTFLAVIVMLTSLSDVAVGQNVSVTDYVVTVSKAKDLRFDVNYAFDRQGDSTRVDQGFGAIAFKKFYNSLPFAWNVDLTGTSSRNRGDFTSIINGIGRFDKYVDVRKDVFAFGRVAVNYDTEADILGRDEPRIDVTIGGGYGRFVNASPLAKAVRIEDFLIREGILRDHLPKEIILELATLIRKEGEYSDRYGAVYEAKWYNDMEKIMARSRLLRKEGLGALGAVRIGEVLYSEKVQDRYYGYDITAGVGATLFTPDTTADRGKALMSLGFRWSRPVAWRSQLDQQFLLSTPFDIHMFDAVTISQTSRLVYELSNRVDVSVSHILFFKKLGNVSEGKDETLVDNSVRFSFLFYLENYINLTANLGFDKYEDRDMVMTFTTGLRFDIW